VCGKPIFGAYVQYSNGLIACSSCEHQRPHCARCGLPALHLDAHNLCPSCQKTAQRCQICGSAIVGTFIRYSSGLIACENCHQRGRHCAHCRRPLRPQETGEFCDVCLNVLPRCGVCRKPITGQFFRFGDSPQPYCPTCSKERPQCDVCGVPVGDDGQRLSGGQDRCGECRKTLVLEDREVQAVYLLVIERTRLVLEGEVRQTPAVVVADPAELSAIRSQHLAAADPDAHTQYIVGFFEQRNGQRTIYVERGLPRATLIGTLAHEFAHAWQADYAPHAQDLLLREGFAEWVAYRVLVTLGHTREAARATRREDEYGRGLRYFITLEQQSGRQRVHSQAMAAISKH
jgi:hypothetical protein